MKTSLFVDRSTEMQSVALVRDGAVAAERTLSGLDSRSGEWVVEVRDFIGGAELSEIVVGTGPGSFAGIRAALAFAQGYAIGAGCEVKGLPSVCALAPEEGPLAVVGDARRGMLWFALFEGRALVGGIRQAEAGELALFVPDGVRVVTTDERRIGAALAEMFPGRYDGGAAPTAGGLARAAIANPSLLVSEPLPVYLNPAVR